MAVPLLARYDVTIPRLHPDHDGVTVVHVTDVHVGIMTPARKIRKAVAMANAANADIVLLTGDYMCYSPKYVPRMGELLGGLRAKAGVVATLGNHDYWTDADGVARALDGNGYTVLRNANTTLNVRGRAMTIVGIDDAVTKNHDPARAFRGADTSGTVLCMTHCPEIADEAEERGAGLVVAGHTHGGQIHVKGVTHKIYKRFGRNYLNGWYDVGDRGTRLYVNRGVGSASLPVRAGHGAKSEVAVFTLRAA